jgi:DNA-binding CsgD family transcriptional regulator
MILTEKSNVSHSEHLWLSLARICISLVVFPTLWLDQSTIRLGSGTMIVVFLFLLWELVTIFYHKLWKISPNLAKSTAFIDLAFCVFFIICIPISPFNWMPTIILLPALELSLFYGVAGAAFVFITFAAATTFSGLLRVSLIAQPSWWTIALLWGILIIFTATLQILFRQHMHYIPSWAYQQRKRLLKQRKIETVFHVDSEAPRRELPRMEDHLALLAPQIANALELPFRNMGVRTEEYHQEIHAAIHALYHLDADREALTNCLQRLLLAAQDNWTTLATFSPREQEIMELLLHDISYKEMSLRLYVSSSTIKTHIYHIFQKLEVSNREEAARRIQKHGWFPQPQSSLLQVKQLSVQ